MKNGFKNVFEYKVIYVFEILDEAHRGLVKIGDATIHTNTPIDQLTPNCRELNQAALTRIKSYTNTAGITPHLLHTELAVRTFLEKDGTLAIKSFRDHQVRDVLINSGFQSVKIGESTGREWFQLDVSLAKKAIDAVKANFANLSHSNTVHQLPIILRPEQAECIDKVVKHFKKSDRFLINAKMRFGKTVVALEIIKRCKFEKTIILTHRPVVNDGWYEDFTKIFANKSDYVYGSKANGNEVDFLLQCGKKFVYFASVQDLRGSEKVGGRHQKNDIVFDTKWDCVIVDEAHEGTTTALGEDTVKAVWKEGCGTKYLALSGTPFNILDSYDEESIYTWDYIMEQECKSEWDQLHFGDSNPYEELPELRIYTYSLGELLKSKHYVAFEDKAFNFKEFFRTWTGDFSIDYAPMPVNAHFGDFVHEADVWSFLNLMTKEDENSCYPFANEEYRDLFKHTFWMLPGVKEALALQRLMMKHPVFGNGMFDIINVAGDGDPEDKNEEALKMVRKAIKNAGSHNYTITLSCGKLATGVTVKEWTGVFMLSGSYSTSAANYLQTIFRVQSPCNKDGKIKETSYVFDFAPDRTLKMVSSAVSVSLKGGKTKMGDQKVMGKFLNYCPVIAVSGSEMKEYSATRLLQQLKKAYADKVVRNGFDDSNLYNDELFKLQSIDIQKFDELKGILGATKASPKAKDITVNNQGFTEEEYEEAEKLEKKPKKTLTPEEKQRLEELKQMKKLRNDAISILRGISIRMPLLIYGADIPYDEEITLDRFVEMVDDSSWEEFMPAGVTKEKFKEFQKYYDEEVFIAAGRRIRNISREADTLEPTERVKKIASLFSYFKNPDKETVLTPWRVVNMHMSDCLGGWDFFDEEHKETIEKPRFVNQGLVTKDTLNNPNAQILEINSKTGLYPLYVTYSIYRSKCNQFIEHELTFEKRKEFWNETVRNNVFVICKTPMAKQITKRTLVGFNNAKINAHYFDDLVNMMQYKPKLFLDKILKSSYWKQKGNVMKFDACVGNPPYQLSEAAGGTNDAAIYQYFVDAALKLDPNYASLIIPARWFAGGRENQVGDFRNMMLNNSSIKTLKVFPTSKDIFPTVEIKGGLCYFQFDKSYNGQCKYTISEEGIEKTVMRNLNDFDILIRDPQLSNFVQKIMSQLDSSCIMVESLISGDTPFGIPTNPETSKKNPFILKRESDNNYNVKLYYLDKLKRSEAFVKKTDIKKNVQDIEDYKVFIPKAGGTGNDQMIIGQPIVAPRNSVCSQTFLYARFNSEFEAQNFVSYLKTKFFRILVSAAKVSQDLMSRMYRFVPIQDFSKPWTDEELYVKYNLTDEEINFIESMIKPMD